MADGWDWLEGLSGGLSGVVKGIDAGMAPLSTWEGIRTKDLANDRYETGNQDIEYQQRARMGDEVPAFYGDWRDSVQSGYQKTTAGNEYDIFGNQQKLELAQRLASPDVQEQLQGLTPGTPQYREAIARIISEVDPYGAVAQYDKMGIPGIQNRNLNEQAALSYVENWAKMKDANATVVRNADGTVSVMSNGEETKLPGDAMVKLAAMMGAKTPYDAISGGVKDEIAIQNANANAYKAFQDGRITPAVMFKYTQDEGVRINQAVQNARLELQNLQKIDTKLMEDSDKAALVARIEQKQADLDRYNAAAERNRQMTSAVVSRLRQTNGVGGGGPQLFMNPITGMPMAGTNGGASVNTPRFSPGANSGRPRGALAAGAAAPGGAPGGGSNGGWDVPGVAPRSAASPRPPVQVLPNWMYGENSGIPPSFNEGGAYEPQANNQLDLNQLLAFAQMFGGMRG